MPASIHVTMDPGNEPKQQSPAGIVNGPVQRRRGIARQPRRVEKHDVEPPPLLHYPRRKRVATVVGREKVRAHDVHAIAEAEPTRVVASARDGAMVDVGPDGAVHDVPS